MSNKLENDFQKNGYIVSKTKEQKALSYLQEKILNFVLSSDKNAKQNFKKYKNIKEYFSNLHKHVALNKLNNLRVNVIKKMNRDKKFRENYYLVAKEGLDQLVGNELAMQNKLNLSLQMPHDKNSQLPMHSDIYAGESPFEVVVWIPLMDIKANNQSMYITNPKDNKIINKEVTTTKTKTLSQIYNKHKKKFKFLKINFGEILIFTPILQHGNVVNTTNTTRMSLNCRFKSLLSPYDVFSKTHRNIPHFYKPLQIKPMTRIGFNFINGVEANKYKINSKY
jgi:sporadic carbohydrate cluster 2OG-Fe(II) oxygenase